MSNNGSPLHVEILSRNLLHLTLQRHPHLDQFHPNGSLQGFVALRTNSHILVILHTDHAHRRLHIQTPIKPLLRHRPVEIRRPLHEMPMLLPPSDSLLIALRFGLPEVK